MAIRLLSSETIDGNISAKGNVTLDPAANSDVSIHMHANSGALGDAYAWNLIAESSADNYEFSIAQGTTDVLKFNNTAAAGNNNATFAGSVTVNGAGSASNGSLSLVSSDSFIRINTTGGTADKRKWDIRTVSASGFEGLDFRTVNDANNAFSTKLSLAHNGTATFAGNVTTGGQVTVPSGYSVNIGTSRIHSTSTSYLLGGNVGIGTASPSANLHVQNTSTATLKVITTGVADASVNIQGYDAGVHIGDATNGLRWAIWNDGPSTSSSLKFGSYALGTWYSDGSQVVTMKSDGKVGIGTTTPDRKLHVNAPDANAGIRLTRAGTSEYHDIGTYYSYTNGNSADFGTTSAHKTFLTTDSYNALEINPQQEVSLLGFRGADGFALTQDQQTGYSNFSAGGFGILFRETRDNYITSNAYYYKTGNVASWRAKYGAYAASVIVQDEGSFNFQTAPANTTSPHNLSFTANRFVIKNTGNVGVNAATPRNKLTVFTDGAAEEEIALRLVNPIGFTNAGSGASIIFAQDRNQGENLPTAKIRSSQAAAGTSCCGDLIFSTHHSGISGMTDKYKITASGGHFWTTDGSFSTSFTYSFRDAVGINNPNSVSAQAVAGYVLSVGRSASGSVAGGIISQGESHFVRGVSFGSSGQDQVLNYYKEGTWTPSLRFGGSELGITYAGAAGTVYRGGHYTRIGRVVTFSFRIILTSKGTATGQATIHGLPFDVAGLPGNYGSAMYSFANNFAIPERASITMDSSSSLIRLRFTNSSGAYSDVTQSGFNNNSDIILTGTYQAAP